MNQAARSTERGAGNQAAFRAAFSLLAAVLIVSALVLAAPAAAQDGSETATADDSGVQIAPAALAGIAARTIGPAVMSGRIADLDAVIDENGRTLVWLGTASGGAWKSTDGGVTFESLFDDHPQSIGAVAIDRSDLDTVWLGTGESWVRNSVSIGHGVYKTTDGGETWQSLGLEETERIARIEIHPEDSDTVWVCATGHLWNANPERGVYKTTDGGDSWELVLEIDEDTGCADLDIDPQDPDVLYAAMWQFRRYPWAFESGGPGSGLYRSKDGGTTWEELTEGLPEGTKGRIAVAVAPSRPNRVYATVEAEDTALYRSDDLGSTWEEVNASFNVTARPFYFSRLVVDPNDHDRVYKPALSLGISSDGGESFGSMLSGGFGGGVHSDHHALWIDPADSNHLILGTDGGVYVSYDRGETFRHVRSLPVSQFYRVAVDMELPYNVFGGLQDNGSWMGPSRSPNQVENRDWRNVGSGDGFWTLRDPSDPDFLYSEYQGGEIRRMHLPTGEFRDIKPYPGEGEPEYRFNWNTPIAFSPHQQGTVYFGAQKLLRSTDRGESWEEISPDLTTDNPEWQKQEESGGLTIDNSTAENHTTIYWIEESPVEAGVIWVGTDDGNLQLTRDGGETWTNVVENVPGVPANTWVSSVTPSPHDAGTAFVTFDGHRSGDMATYVYATTDYGATWTDLSGDELEGYAFIVRQDPVQPELLFLGTEWGLWISLDRGAHWVRFEGGLPSHISVQDLVIHPRDGDLVLGTHGRGIWILDDLTPLRSLTRETLDRDVALLPTRPAEMFIPSQVQDFSGDGEFYGENPPEAATIAYWLKRRHLFGDLKVEIYDADGELITTIPGSKRRGLNRVQWPMRLPAPKLPPSTALVPAFQGPLVLEGTYTVKLIKGDEVLEGTVELIPDRRSRHSAEDRRLQQTTALEIYEMLGDLTYLVEALDEGLEQAEARLESTDDRRVRRALEPFTDTVQQYRDSLVATSEAGWLSGEERLREELGNLYGAIDSYTGRPTRSQLDRLEVLRGRLETAFSRFDELATELAEVNRDLERRDVEPVAFPSREEWEASQETGAQGSTAVALDRPVKPKGPVLTLLHRLATRPVAVPLR